MVGEKDMEETRALIVDESVAGRLTVARAPLVAPREHEVVIKVAAISLNRGEVKRALTLSSTGARPGWDFAGVVERAAQDGSGPPVGARVVGLLASGAWAERVVVAADAVAVLPDAVSFAQAATLPVAGLTALYALRKGGLLLGRKVLIDGASGGVGHLGVQLANAAGAEVYGHVRGEAQRASIAQWCAGVIVGDLEQAREHGPYDLILDSVGGATLGKALSLLANRGACVTFGVSEGLTTTFNSAEFFRTAGTRLYGLMLFDELLHEGEPSGYGLAMLGKMVADGRLQPHIAVEASWEDAAQIAESLMERRYLGKAVLHVTA